MLFMHVGFYGNFCFATAFDFNVYPFWGAFRRSPELDYILLLFIVRIKTFFSSFSFNAKRQKTNEWNEKLLRMTTILSVIAFITNLRCVLTRANQRVVYVLVNNNNKKDLVNLKQENQNKNQSETINGKILVTFTSFLPLPLLFRMFRFLCWFVFWNLSNILVLRFHAGCAKSFF